MAGGQTQVDEINLKSLQKTTSGQLFAAIQTANTNPTDPLIGVVARDTNGVFSFHEYSQVQHNDRNPILLIDEGDVNNANDDKIYTFVTSGGGGGTICYKTLNISTPLSGMGNFNTMPVNCGIPLMADSTYNGIDNATTTRQTVNRNTGIVILAAHDKPPVRFYVHGKLGDPSPVVTARTPGINAANVPVSSLVSVTFSKPMSATTLNTSNFSVEDGGGPIAGSIGYNSTTRTATFTPSAPLNISTVYTIKLTQDIKDTSGNTLNEGFETALIREQWSFTTTDTAQFSLTVSTVGSGSVALDPPGGIYNSGTVVTMTATPGAGYLFSGWDGDVTGTTNPETVTMTSNKSVTATFTASSPDTNIYLPMITKN
jgi:uncharacterized repeat protein (TIGR02543 family)